MQSEVELIKPFGLVRFMLYTDTNRRRAVQLGEDVWGDVETLFGDRYAYGQELRIAFLDMGPDPVSYVVAMLPLVKQVPRPGVPGEKVTMRVVYLATQTLWPFFEPIGDQNLTTALMPSS